MSKRFITILSILALGASIVAWAVLRSRLPVADFTFGNETEIKSIDPATVTGIPEHRILDALFEGLCRANPETQLPAPGVAESWDLSDDKKVYTFHLRADAKWSNGEPVTAHDFLYGLHRTINPLSGHRYAYQAWYIKNAKRYSSGLAGIDPGDRVEVELNLTDDQHDNVQHDILRGELLHGELVSKSPEVEGADISERRIVVRMDGQDMDGRERTFALTDSSRGLPEGVEPCRQILLDFDEVGIKVIDDRTLVTELSEPTPFWLQLTAHYALFPLYQPCLETHGSPAWTYPENIVGNGSYRLQLWRIRDRMRLVKSDTYWDRKHVRLNVVDAMAVDSRITAINMYETGQLDWVTDIESLIAGELMRQGRGKVDLNPSPFLGTYFYGFNLSKKPLDDIRVRRALCLAINRKEICETATGSGEIPTTSYVPPGIHGYQAQQGPSENVEEARRLLAEAGYADGIGFPKFEILYNSDETHQNIAELIRKQWQRNLGITVAMRNEEWGSYLNSQRQMNFSICRRSWIGDYQDANTYLDMFVTGGENNRCDWSNAEYDQLIANAAVEVDEEKRLRLLEKAEQILMEELPIMPIHFYVSRNLVRPYVRGFYNNLLDLHPLHAIYIDHDAPEPNEYMATAPYYQQAKEP